MYHDPTGPCPEVWSQRQSPDRSWGMRNGGRHLFSARHDQGVVARQTAFPHPPVFVCGKFLQDADVLRCVGEIAHNVVEDKGQRVPP